MKALIAGLAAGAAALALSAAPTTAAAMGVGNFQPGWYVTAEGGRSDINAQNVYSNSLFQMLNQDGATYSHSGSTTDTGYGIAVGYQVTENWGFDLGYFDFGKGYEDIHGTGQWSGSLHDDMKVKGFTLMLVGTAPLTSHFAIYGKFGIIRAHTSLNTSGVVTGPGGSVYPQPTGDSTNVDFGYGAGIAWRFNPHFDIHGGWTQYRDVGAASSGGSDNLNFTYVGVRFGF
jgi:Outer membrane protein beta-barrel domain